MPSFLEFVTLLEHDMEKTWERYGDKIHTRMSKENVIEFPHHYDGEERESFNKREFEDNVAAADPTPHGEYHQWIAKHYANEGISRFEDIGARVKPALRKFHEAKIKKQLGKYGISADINQHKGLSALEDAVDKLPAEMRSRREVKDAEATKMEDDHWHVIIPHTKEAARLYGANTRWCTAAEDDNDNMFDHYNSEGHLHIFIPKKPRYEGEKYQYHVNPEGDEQFMDEKDHSVANDSFDGVHHSQPFAPKRHDLKSPAAPARPSSILHDIVKTTGQLLNGDVRDKDPAHYPNPAHRMMMAYADHPHLEKLAHDLHPGVRAEAFNAMSPNNPQHIKWAKEALNDPDHHVSGTIANIFPQFHDTLINHPDKRTRLSVAYSSVNPEVLKHLAIKDKDPDVNYSAAYFLSKHDTPYNQEVLDHFVKHPAASLRVFVADSQHITKKHIDILRKDSSEGVNDILKSRGLI